MDLKRAHNYVIAKKSFQRLFNYRAGEEIMYEEMILEHSSATKAKIIKDGPNDFLFKY